MLYFKSIKDLIVQLINALIDKRNKKHIIPKGIHQGYSVYNPGSSEKNLNIILAILKIQANKLISIASF